MSGGKYVATSDFHAGFPRKATWALPTNPPPPGSRGIISLLLEKQLSAVWPPTKKSSWAAFCILTAQNTDLLYTYSTKHRLLKLSCPFVLYGQSEEIAISTPLELVTRDECWGQRGKDCATLSWESPEVRPSRGRERGVLHSPERSALVKTGSERTQRETAFSSHWFIHINGEIPPKGALYQGTHFTMKGIPGHTWNHGIHWLGHILTQPEAASLTLYWNGVPPHFLSSRS